MTISTETSRIRYLGNGTTDTYPYTFKIFDDEDLVVVSTVIATGVETTLTLTTDYTVTGVGVDGGGNVVLVAGNLASGYALTIQREVDIIQDAAYTEGDSFPAVSHEEALDYLCMVDQQLDSKLDRVPMVAASFADVPLELPVNLSGAAAYVRWNAAGTALEVSSTLPSTDVGLQWIAVASYGGGTLNDAALTEALATNPGGGQLYFGAPCAITTAISIPTGFTIVDGLYQIFSCTGTGAVTFGAGVVDYIKPEWWGANASTDSADAVNAALTAAVTNKNTVQFSGWYKCDSTINFPANPNIAGIGKLGCGIDSYADDAAITGTGKIDHQYFANFGVTQENNTNAGSNLIVMDLQYGSSWSMYTNIQLTGKAAVTMDGFVIRGEHPTAGVNTNQFSNVLTNVRTFTADTEIPGVAIKLYGVGTAGSLCNNNNLISCCPGSFRTGIYIMGQNNKVTLPVFNGTCSDAAIEIASIVTTGLSVENIIDGPYFDAAVVGSKILLTAGNNEADASWCKFVAIRNVLPQGFLPSDVVIAGAGAAKVRYSINDIDYYPSNSPNGFTLPLGSRVVTTGTDLIWTKVGTGTDAWTDWVPLKRFWSSVVSVDVGNVAAGSELEFNITPSTLPSTSATVTTVNNIALADGLIIRRVYFNGTVIKVKLYNYTAGDIDPASQAWRYVITEY